MKDAKKKTPETKVCTDRNCPVHGQVRLHGRSFVGTVVSDKMKRTVTVSWEWKKFVPKYERYTRKRSKIHAHNPDCIDARKGDLVTIKETRPLSKSKTFVVIDKHARNVRAELKDQIVESHKIDRKKKEKVEVKEEKEPKAKAKGRNKGEGEEE